MRARTFEVGSEVARGNGAAGSAVVGSAAAGGSGAAPMDGIWGFGSSHDPTAAISSVPAASARTVAGIDEVAGRRRDRIVAG